MVAREEQQPFPPDVVTSEQRRRWELCVMSAFMTLGFSEDDPPADRWDLALLQQTSRTYYERADMPTGEGTLTDEQRAMLRNLQAL